MTSELDIHVASPAEREEIYRQSYDIWGRKDLSVEEHVAWRMTHSQHSWGTWYVGCQNGNVVASLAAYSNRFGFHGTPIKGIAIASVFTHPDHRGHGFAPQVLAFAEERAKEAGNQISLLYSDIGTDYYGQMGYVACDSWQGTRDLADAEIPEEPTLELFEFDGLDEADRLAVLYEQASCDDAFHFVRTPDYWQAFLGKDRDDHFFWLGDNSAADGYVRLRVGPRRMLIRDWVWPVDWTDQQQAAALNAVLKWGKQQGVEQAICWAPPTDAFQNAFQIDQRKEEITMIKPLDATIKIDEIIRKSAARLREIDHV